MSWLTGSGGELGIVAAKAVLIYLTAVLALRVGQRRTITQWTSIDFAAAVAIGAIIGRTAVASGQSFAIGAVALVTILGAHLIVMYARFNRRVAKLVDHRVRVLLVDGQLRRDQLRVCGLTENDVFARLREKGIRNLGELRYVVATTRGQLSPHGAPRQRERTGSAQRARRREGGDDHQHVAEAKRRHFGEDA
jgi:uncharacterized membrane protein YcaP (DUF421 family)